MRYTSTKYSSSMCNRGVRVGASVTSTTVKSSSNRLARPAPYWPTRGRSRLWAAIRPIWGERVDAGAEQRDRRRSRRTRRSTSHNRHGTLRVEQPDRFGFRWARLLSCPGSHHIMNKGEFSPTAASTNTIAAVPNYAEGHELPANHRNLRPARAWARLQGFRSSSVVSASHKTRASASQANRTGHQETTCSHRSCPDKRPRPLS